MGVGMRSNGTEVLYVLTEQGSCTRLLYHPLRPSLCWTPGLGWTLGCLVQEKPDDFSLSPLVPAPEKYPWG